MILKLRKRRNSILFEIKAQLFQNDIADAMLLVKVTCIFCTILYFTRQILVERRERKLYTRRKEIVV